MEQCYCVIPGCRESQLGCGGLCQGQCGRETETFPRNSQTWNRPLRSRQQSNLLIAPIAVGARHDLHPAWCADRQRIAAIEPGSGSGQLVEPRGGEEVAAVATEAIVGDIVGHDQHDVSLIRGRRRRPRRTKQNPGTQASGDHRHFLLVSGARSPEGGCSPQKHDVADPGDDAAPSSRVTSHLLTVLQERPLAP